MDEKVALTIPVHVQRTGEQIRAWIVWAVVWGKFSAHAVKNEPVIHKEKFYGIDTLDNSLNNVENHKVCLISADSEIDLLGHHTSGQITLS